MNYAEQIVRQQHMLLGGGNFIPAQRSLTGMINKPSGMLINKPATSLAFLWSHYSDAVTMD
ncbi:MULTISPECIES: hypothetical protein [Tatumella]|uniref:Uncharacterized protein n=1 Tax=Tatumella punctata TaxID=399969 RepID=A0ABW1VI03_9GAMM|nr:MULTISPECIES: hypothetical protein [unclassified Tatumella]MBS0856458.1 hypothetical protein [Tatumella sp. JGM16]MBS0911458.1 hypothetical protein [Tatumella sp. JGM91]